MGGGSTSNDVFIFESNFLDNGLDTITDFNVYEPIIENGLTVSTLEDELDFSLIFGKNYKINSDNVDYYIRVHNNQLLINTLGSGEYEDFVVWAKFDNNGEDEGGGYIDDGDLINVRTQNFDGKIVATNDAVSITVSTAPLIDSNLTAENFWRGALSGIELTSNTEGNIKLGDVQINVQAINGKVTVGGSGGVQTTAAQGAFSVINGGVVGTDTSAIAYALGTDGSDTLLGQYVWGYDGFDIITGTDEDDWLIGGDGGGSITGGKGADYMFGGSGIDTFIISSANSDTGTKPGGPGESPTSDSVFNFSTGTDKLDLDIAGTADNFEYVLGFSPGNIDDEDEALLAAQGAISEDTRYVYMYNVTNSGNSWLYYFADGNPSNYTIVELVALSAQSQFVFGDII